jgi:hypothetical protein
LQLKLQSPSRFPDPVPAIQVPVGLLDGAEPVEAGAEGGETEVAGATIGLVIGFVSGVEVVGEEPPPAGATMVVVGAAGEVGSDGAAEQVLT